MGLGVTSAASLPLRSTTEGGDASAAVSEVKRATSVQDVAAPAGTSTLAQPSAASCIGSDVPPTSKVGVRFKACNAATSSTCTPLWRRCARALYVVAPGSIVAGATSSTTRSYSRITPHATGPSARTSRSSGLPTCESTSTLNVPSASRGAPPTGSSIRDFGPFRADRSISSADNIGRV